MNKKIYRDIIFLLQRAKVNGTVMTGEDLALEAQMSSRTVRKRIKEINELLLTKGASIISKQGIGYDLKIVDNSKFQKFLELELPMTIQEQEDLNDQDNRYDYLIGKLLSMKDYRTLDNLGEDLYISKNQVSIDMEHVRQYLAPFNLTIVSKPHYGSRVEGSEFQKRLCLKSVYLRHHDHVDSFVINKLKDILSTSLRKYDCSMSDDATESIVFHLYMMLERVKNKFGFDQRSQFLSEQKHESEYGLANTILGIMEEMFDVVFDDYEYGYLTIHLQAKNVVKVKSHTMISTEVYELTLAMIYRIYEKVHIDLRSDLDLQIMLAQHLVALIKRIQYHMVMKNPLLEDIKRKLLYSYDLAIVACQVLKEYYKCDLNENEIAYIALHFNVAVDKKHDAIVKKKVLLICSSGGGSARLLEYKFRNEFDRYIDVLATRSASELSEELVSQFDCIFATFPIVEKYSIPLIQIQYFMDNDDYKNITNILSNRVTNFFDMKYFEENLFLSDVHGETKEEVIRVMVDHIAKSRDIPEDFYEKVIEREEMFVTDFGRNVAFPHPIIPLTDFTFVCVAVLAKPVLWGKNKVQLVFLASIEKGDKKNIQTFYKILSTILMDSRKVSELMKQPMYSTLKNMISDILNKGV